MKQDFRKVNRPLVQLGKLSIYFALAWFLPPQAASAQWPQFGGPHRNFMCETKGLAAKWAEDGPKKLWTRELGDGYATIVADGGVLYTMYRTGDDEFTVALDEKTGKTVWEHKNPSPFTKLMAEFGPGPHSTPLLVGDRLYTIGTNAVLHCFDKKTGKVLWLHDLPKEFNGDIPGRGYGASPIAYKSTVILAVDRKREDEEDGDKAEENKEAKPVEGQSLMAFDQATGDVVWKAHDYPVSYASPILIRFEGEEQLVLLMEKEIIGVNPDDGTLLWHHAMKPEGANLATPVWIAPDMLFCSSAYDSGSRVLKLSKKDGKTVPEELWYSRKMRVHHANAIPVGDYVYGSSGDFGPAFFMGVNLKTGEIAWRERGFAKSTCVYADGKFILLDEDGQLGLATATPEGLTVHSKCKLTERYSWAAPTLVGAKLYLRDRKNILALDLSADGAGAGLTN